MQLAADLSVAMSCGSATLEYSSLEASSSTVHGLSWSSGRCVVGTALVKKWSIICHPGFSRFDMTFVKTFSIGNEL
jgi:hypothetical protein